MENRRSIEPSLNTQVGADKNRGIIVAQDVVTDETDNGQLIRMLDKVKENMGMVAQERKYEILVNAPSNEIPVFTK